MFVAKVRFYRNIQRLWLLAVLLLLLGIAFRDFFLTQKSICVIKRISGYECPTCGSTRAVFAFFGGQFLHSLRLNLIGFFVASAVFIFPFIRLSEWLFARPFLFEWYLRFQVKLANKRNWIAVLLLVLAYWIYFYSVNLKYIRSQELSTSKFLNSNHSDWVFNMDLASVYSYWFLLIMWFIFLFGGCLLSLDFFS